MSTWKASPFVAFTVARSRPRSERVDARLVGDAVARELRGRSRGFVGFSLKGDVDGAAAGAGGGVERRSGLGRIEELRGRPRPASPFRETSSSFASLIPAGKRTTRTAMPAASSFPFNASVALRPASSLSSARMTRFTRSRFRRSRWSGVKPFVP